MNISIPVTFQSDAKGYIDRMCPAPRCHYTFKVLTKDWEKIGVENEVHCPLCGHEDISDKWCTQGQLREMRKIAESWTLNQIQRALDKSFSRLASSTRHNQILRVTYQPGHRVPFLNMPIGQMEQWETEICCEKCGTHYSVIGAAYFCPCCGYNSAVNSFNDSLDSIKQMLDSLKDIKSTLAKMQGIDDAETLNRMLLENSILNMVSAFQQFACCKYGELSGKASCGNSFQGVDNGSQLFEKVTGKKYADWLSPDELDFMQVMFQKRHLLAHNNGMVDQKYLEKSGDSSYLLGQRIVMKKTDAYALLDIVRKLGNGLMEIQTRSKSDGKQ